jgi:hypothetical protein
LSIIAPSYFIPSQSVDLRGESSPQSSLLDYLEGDTNKEGGFSPKEDWGGSPPFVVDYNKRGWGRRLLLLIGSLIATT